MAFGFKISDSSGNTIIDSTKTTALLKEKVVETSATTGSQTWTDATGRTAYGFGVMQTNGSIIAGTYSGITYGISTSVDGSNNPTASWNISCNNLAPAVGDACAQVTAYNLFFFTK